MSINGNFSLTTDSLQLYVEFNFDYYNDPETGEQFYRVVYDLGWSGSPYRSGGVAEYPGHSEIFDFPGAADASYTIDINALEEWSGASARWVRNVVIATHSGLNQQVAGSTLDDVVWSGSGRDVVQLFDGNDFVWTDEGADTIYGGAGGDVIDGGLGDDLMFGGLGDDVFFVDSTGDRVIERGGEGRDSILSSVSYDLGRPLPNNVENLSLLGVADLEATGNSHGNVLIGNVGDNILRGFAGNDSLNGFGGRDTLVGGVGNDRYTIDADDTIVELAGEGVDTVVVGSDYSLVGTNIENIEMAQGYVGWRATGNASDNLLTGNLGDNVLNGGRGGDRMIGGFGDDLYYVDDVRDRVVEEGGHGTDTVRASIDYKLGRHLENLTLIGASDIKGSGNDADNILVGNTGNNELWGGFGDDRLRGSTGDDFLHGGAGRDIFIFRDGDGDDRIVDFQNYADRIDLRGVAGLNRFEQLKIVYEPTEVLIDYGTGTIRLHYQGPVEAQYFLL